LDFFFLPLALDGVCESRQKENQLEEQIKNAPTLEEVLVFFSSILIYKVH
jgi:hypothetical protein